MSIKKPPVELPPAHTRAVKTAATLPASKESTLPFYTIGEEIANSVLHGAGMLAAVAGLVLLNLKTRGIFGGEKEAGLDITAALLFTSAMIAMFLISTLYHAIQHPAAKRVLRILDHSAVYVFIAGTYTPFCLSGLKGTWGWVLFFIEWGLALTGIILYATGSKALKKIEVAVYILMGWAIVAGWVPLVRSVSPKSIALLLGGGVAYTLGTLWYRKKTVRKTHVVWHVFVLAGALCHWFAVWNLG